MLRPSRYRDRIIADRAAAYSVLDEALVCHVGVVIDGRPHVLPTLHARVGDTLYVHGSTAARILAAARPEPLAVCVTVSLLDGLVLARSAFHHSLNYRSVVVHGDALLVAGADEKTRMLAALVDRVGTDRSAQCRPPSPKELAATAVLAVDLAAEGTDVALKARAGGPIDDEADHALGHWAGVVPIRLVAGVPEPDGDRGILPTPVGLAPTLR
ncbi:MULTISPECIES: pyridoxamine 5'-phosphate oxidase family protein [Pseudofrankia]|uniref:pyridoxamine 5'-phosphate oxidase family protein n=1 Tax=Pseudofrankia TaxID=2994363 RepID=UPI000234C462|nr:MULTISPECIES: pyridoxamine 5'-phosphate oxidase family protein [Pseudofrankia]OHV42055.1 flavin-nucleotide-binding protein [Pseudofrankia sp. EUN1h]